MDFACFCNLSGRTVSYYGSGCQLADTNGFKLLSLKTINNLYGYMLVSVKDTQAYSAYEPFLRNICNIVARVIESRHTMLKLKEANERLELRVLEATEGLRESEQKYRSLFENSPDAIFITDSQTGYIVDANFSASLLLGRSVNEIKGMHQSQLYPKSKEQCLGEAFEKNVRPTTGYERSYPFETYVMRADGKEIPVEILAQKILSKGTLLLQGVFRDIRERKHMEEVIRRELDFQRAVAELSEALLSPEMDIVDISIIINKQAIRLTESVHGYVSEIDDKTEEFISHTTTEMLEEGQCKIDTRRQRLAFPKGKDGYNGLWGHSLNTKQGYYVNNPEAHPAYKGCVPKGHIPLNRYMAVPAIIKDKLIGQIAVANAQRDYTDDDLNIIKRLATIYALAVERKRMEDELKNLNNNLEQMVATETEKRQKQEQILIQQSKMAAMGEMIGLIAHQWKQPLNAVASLIQDFKDAYSCGEVDDKYIDNTVISTMEQISFMSKTIDDFRNFFVPSKRKVLFNVKSAIDELFSMFLHVFHKSNIDVSTKTATDAILLTEGYPNEFKQVLLNILNNSKDAIASKISTSTKTRGTIEININNSEDKSKIIISIRDNGGGVPEDILERIFEPYFTTKEAGGTGLGLYMSKTIIETNMGGMLRVGNAKGGAEFLISLNNVDVNNGISG